MTEQVARDDIPFGGVVDAVVIGADAVAPGAQSNPDAALAVAAVEQAGRVGAEVVPVDPVVRRPRFEEADGEAVAAVVGELGVAVDGQAADGGAGRLEVEAEGPGGVAAVQLDERR